MGGNPSSQVRRSSGSGGRGWFVLGKGQFAKGVYVEGFLLLGLGGNGGVVEVVVKSDVVLEGIWVFCL